MLYNISALYICIYTYVFETARLRKKKRVVFLSLQCINWPNVLQNSIYVLALCTEALNNFHHPYFSYYSNVASSKTSRLEAHADLFILIMKRILNPYVK